MDDGRGVVLGILAVERVVNHRFAQVSVTVCLTNTFVYGILKQLAYNVDILTDLSKYNHHAGVLTDRKACVLGHLVVFDDGVDRALSVWRDLVI